ncbi:MAG: TrkH family potassium uptake protein [Clostridia bacterium]|nr:TrkH family potassium uptake protein [Clostridia bacterium]
MNFKMIGRFQALILLIEAAFMLPALLICLFDREFPSAMAFLKTMILNTAVSGVFLFLFRGAKREFYQKEGLLCVGLSWIVMSLSGALPFVFSGAIPHFVDAFFETVSGFTTTGATILHQVEVLPRGLLYWRSFTHWIGGMGILVFLIAIAPAFGKQDGFNMYIMRAESSGPSVGKLVPKIRQTAAILYILYLGLTLLNIFFLLIGKMPLFDAVCTAFGTAGTGGFGVKNDSIAGYSPYLQNVCTIFMLLFGVSFSCYFLLVRRQFKMVVMDEELRLYGAVALISTLLITLNLRGFYPTFSETVRHAAFQVSSIMTTTGFSTTDFDAWPAFSKVVLLCLMIIGACAGSTGGGVKCIRWLLLFKNLRRNVKTLCSPQRIQTVHINGKTVPESTVDNTNAFLAAYVLLLGLSFLVVSLDEFSVTTNFSAVVACLNNIGPGLETVGPVRNFALFSVPSKLVLIVDMLAGRLEIFPILILFSRSAWRKR